MTEAAIKRAKKIKRNRIIAIISALLVAVLLVLWAVQFNITNARAVKQEIEYYEMGEFVEIGDNFYYSATEKSKGYSIRINSARLENYEEYVKANGGEITEGRYSADYPMPKYIVVVDMTVKNEGNTEGGINSRNFTLTNGSMSMGVDYELLALVEEFFDENVGFKLVENTEADLTMIFTPESLGSSLGIEYNGVNRVLEEEDFYFSVCEWPVRRVIRVEIDK